LLTFAYGTGALAKEKKKKQSDLAQLLKARLNLFVLITTLFGFLCAMRDLPTAWSGGVVWTLVHTIIGTAAAAFGSAAFNQLLEIKEDSQMKRTSDRPLPSRRMSVIKAFAIGWSLAAFGIIHLAAKVNVTAATLAAVTIVTYVFIYTPLKKISSINTLVGAIPGALPPLIGWTAAGGGLWAIEGWFLFALLFMWQLPHFVSINWLCREEYEEAGYKMWSNGDISGRFSGHLSAAFSVILALLAALPLVYHFGSWIYLIVAGAFGLWLVQLSLSFAKSGERPTFRKLFLMTLLYLPVSLTALVLDWRA